MTALSAAQMAIVEHGTVYDAWPDELDIEFTDRDVSPHEAMRVIQLERRNDPRTRTSQGYCEVYRYVGEEYPRDHWYAVRVYDGGASGSVPYADRSTACARIFNDVAGTRRFWDGYVGLTQTEDGGRIIRAGGQHYVAGRAYQGAGFGGAHWLFRMLATGEIVDTRNLWSQGRIPDDYRHRLPDNAVNVKAERRRQWRRTSARDIAGKPWYWGRNLW